jgi:hypothetical protein
MAIKISRIEKEYILKTMVDGKLEVELQIADKRYRSVLVQYRPENLVFSLPPDLPPFADRRRADVFISFRGTRLTCTLAELACVKQHLHAEMPANFYRDLSRGFERIHPEIGISVSFYLEGAQYRLDFPTSEEFYEPDHPSLNIKFDAARITNLLKAFREKALSFSSENKIVMFRERKPTSIPERLIAQSGRLLLLPLGDADSLVQPKNPDTPKILTHSDVTRYLNVEGQDPVQASIELSRFVDALYQKKIWHEMYTPVLYREYVVGYIYLMRSDLQTSGFSANTLDFVQQFARLLSYSLKQNGYFQMIPVREAFNRSELVDISGSGLLFSMPLNGPSLEIYTDLDLQVQIAERTIAAKGRVMRRYQDSGRIYIGIKFLDLSVNDQQFLFVSLYGENPLLEADAAMMED